ncbi:MAG: PTS system mannose/fructose/sorbose family transporter subunit IID [Gemmatimonadaceae bacterium]
MFLRTLTVQSAWNYEVMLGTGIGFCTEPALRSLPEGPGQTAYREALARQSRYFNAHPYLASLAVGALARAELDGEPPAQIERFRAALCGPLGSIGDRLVWAGWLPFCSLLSLTAFGLGAGATATMLLFLVVYNIGHFGLRAWGLREGWRYGMRVATALNHPVLRQGPEVITWGVALLAGFSIPLTLNRLVGSEMLGRRAGVLEPPFVHGRAADIFDPLTVLILSAAVLLAALLVRLHGRVEGWRVAVYVLLALALYSVA